MVGDDFGKFLLDIFGAFRFTTKTGQNMGSLLEIALPDEVTRGLGKKEETNTKDQGPEHLDSNGNAIRASIAAVLGAIIDARSQ